MHQPTVEEGTPEMQLRPRNDGTNAPQQPNPALARPRGVGSSARDVQTMTNRGPRWSAFLLVVAALHFGWEMAHSRWFASMDALPFWTATWQCARATLGDLVITAVAFMIAAATARSILWPLKDHFLPAAAIFVATGLAITVGYEIFALSTGRWRYDETMPTVAGIGLLPLLQWLLLPLIELAAFRLLWRRETIGGSG